MSITIDSVTYKANWVKDSLKCKAEIINGDASGRLQGTKAMYLDYVGTFFNYSGDIRRAKDCSDAEWESLFLALTNPINDHTITVPFGSAWDYDKDHGNSAVSTTATQTNMTSRFYISSVERVLLEQKTETAKNASQVSATITANKWDRIYRVTFTAMAPQRLANSPTSISGVS